MMRNRIINIGLALLLLTVALVPLLYPVEAMQSDERKHWYHRSYRFLEALKVQNWAATVQTEHPGVTTMALGAIGHAVQNRINIARTNPFTEQLELLRTPVKITNALIVPLAFAAMLMLWDRRLALIAALLWAADPYLRWYSRLLHIDAMSAGFMGLSLLLLLIAFRTQARSTESDPLPSVRWGWLIAAAVVGGLAALTRFPSFFMVGMAGIITLVRWATYRQQITPRRFALQIALPVVVFTLGMIITWTALYPAMWTNRSAIIDETLHGFDNAASAHRSGNYFLGQATGDPGVLFYPVALIVRVSPLVLIGLLLLIPALRSTTNGQPITRQTLTILLLYIVFYMIVLTIASKKFDRYLLPIFPALFVLAGWGWSWLFAMLQARWTVAHRYAIAVFAAAVIGYGLIFFPNEFAHANPLVGGGKTAQWALLMGDGEGLDEVYHFILSEGYAADTCDLHIYAAVIGTVEIYFPCADVDDVDFEEPDWIDMGQSDYVVRYIEMRQRTPYHQTVFDFITPIHTVRYYGITYAEVYRGADVWQSYIENCGTADLPCTVDQAAFDLAQES